MVIYNTTVITFIFPRLLYSHAQTIKILFKVHDRNCSFLELEEIRITTTPPSKNVNYFFHIVLQRNICIFSFDINKAKTI